MIQHITKPFKYFFKLEASSGLVLLFAAILALIISNGDLSEIPVRDYGKESHLHYHQFIDACLGKDECTAPFSYSSRLTETILLGVIAGRFPGKTLHWDNSKAKFEEDEANIYLDSTYRDF